MPEPDDDATEASEPDDDATEASEPDDDATEASEPEEARPVPERDSAERGTEVSDRLRERRSAFFRRRVGSTSAVSDLPEPTGGRWTEEESDRQIRAFLLRLAEGRQLVHRDDPVQFLRENDLLLLFGPEEEEAFAALALRFPDETVSRWATLLSGGDRSEAFGPRSRAERRDEAAVVRSLHVGLRKRVLSVLVFLILAGGLVALGRTLLTEAPEDRSERALRFASPVVDDSGDGRLGSVAGGPPVVEPALVASADLLVAVLRGDGEPADRIRLDVPARELPVALGAVVGTVFEHAGGQVAMVGPEGWWTEACIRVAVATELLRPLDVVVHEDADGACPADVVGRQAHVTCAGDRVLVLAVDIPQGAVALIEGGSAWAESIRFGVETTPSAVSRWETLAVRGSIVVPDVAEAVAIPRFGGSSGDELTFDLDDTENGPSSGTCVLT
ncbi:MAG: hypothetical protein NZ600_11110 [Acidimicrobiales bacterium]|nr:hypothetical protein [Acidimicrobiales bacterium]